MQEWGRSRISKILPAVSSIVLSCLAPLAPLGAQIIPDGTLGAETSVVTPKLNNGIPSEQINGGAIRGANLFHSFREFNINAGRAAYFTTPAGIETILSRVTGTHPSNILGTLGVLGNANLFLINPNGIIFGPNARLDVAGSFLASTANTIVFGNNLEFSATNPQSPPLLTINRPLGLNYQTQQPGSLINTGNLAVPQGQNLTLAGGTVVTTGQLVTPGGQLSVLAVPGASFVQLGQAGQVLSVSPASKAPATTAVPSTLPALLNTVGYDTGVRAIADNQLELKASGAQVPIETGTVIVSGTLDASNSAVGKTGGTIQVLGNHVGLFDTTRINASGAAGGGTVLIGGNYRGQGIVPQATATYVGRDVSINADALQAGNGGQIVVWANDSTRAYGSLSARGGAFAGNGGLIETSSRNFLSTSGIKVNTTATQGLAGTWLIDPRNIIIQNAATANGTFSGGNPNVFTPTGDHAFISTQDIEAQLNAGTNVTITTGNTGNQEGNITVADSVRKTAGGAATLTLEAANNITLNSGALITSHSDALNIFLLADSDRSGAGDLVMVGTGEPNLYEIEANGGDVSITANSVLLDHFANIHSDANGNRNGGSITLNARSVVMRAKSGMGSDTFSKGNAGQVTITADTVSFEKDSGMSTLTKGDGNAGQITINAGTVSFDHSGLGTSSSRRARGNAGQITINANTLTLNNSGISTSTDGRAKGGTITVNAGTLTLKDSSFNSNANGTGDAGQMNIQAGSLYLNNSALNSNTSNQGNAGQIAITAGSAWFENHSGINTNAEGSGNGGQITLTANSAMFDTSGIDSSTYQHGEGGTITINAGSLVLKDKGFGSNTLGSGNAGEININAGRVTLENTGIGTSSEGSGKAGQVNVTAGSLSLQHSALTSNAYGDGNAGQVNIKAGSISLTDMSALASGTSGQGNGGQVNITAKSVSLTGGSGISTETDGRGDAGQINITADSVVLQESILSSQTSSTGNGGQIDITADLLSIEGNKFALTTDTGEKFGISTDSSSSGKGGNVTLHVGELRVRDGAEIAVKSSGSGDAGTLTIVGDSIRLDNQASLNADTTGGQGNINLHSVDLVLRHGSNITTNARGQDKIGGNITINTGVLVALENSDITADSADFRGGNVNVTAQGIFGTAFRPAPTPDSDITATGANSSLSGTVVINRFGVDPNQGLTNLPTEVVDASSQIAQNCSAAGGKTAQNQFIVTGRGGLPDNPGETLSPDAVWTDLRHSSVVSSTRQEEDTQKSATNRRATSSQLPIVEASGWEINNKGEVVLTANNPANTKPQHPWSNPATCTTR